jgi:hypothetical protein
MGVSKLTSFFGGLSHDPRSGLAEVLTGLTGPLLRSLSSIRFQCSRPAARGRGFLVFNFFLDWHSQMMTHAKGQIPGV